MVSVDLHRILVKINDLSFKFQFSFYTFDLIAHLPLFLSHYISPSSAPAGRICHSKSVCSGTLKRKPSSLDKGYILLFVMILNYFA